MLQADFDASALDNFIFTILRETSTKAQAEHFESVEIISRLEKGESLYNKTLDGKGTSNTNSQSTNTISDVFNKNGVLSTQSPVTKSKTLNDPPVSRRKIRDVSQDNPPLPNKQLSTTHTHANGGTYEGTFIEKKLTGRGKYTSVNGDIYEGDLVDGELTGKGKYTFANGDTYVGSFNKGRRTGEGKFTRKA